MGEARRRGTAETRIREAIKRNKAALVASFGDIDSEARKALQAGLDLFLNRLSAQEWQARRKGLIDVLRSDPGGRELAKAKSVRVQQDEIAWYLFLCEQALDDPLCTDVSQAQRALPFLAGIGARASYAPTVEGLDRKLDELLGQYKTDPDGLLFELCVALAYAECGWRVAFLEEGQVKTPDMRAVREDQELYIECKRMARSTQYSEQERKSFLELWDNAKNLLTKNKQWIWFKAEFHVEAHELPKDLLREIFSSALPIKPSPDPIHDSDRATVYARLIDRAAVERHFLEFRVKGNSPMLTHLLGGDWAPEDAAVTLMHLAKTSQVVGCELPVLGTYIDSIHFACGITRQFDAEIAIEKKARDITKLLSEAVKQVPSDQPSVIHIAAETMEGAVVERRRTERVMAKVPDFVTGKPVAGVRFHRLQCHQRTSLMFEVDETVDKFGDHQLLAGIPHTVVVPVSTPMRSGAHWDLYG